MTPLSPAHLPQLVLKGADVTVENGEQHPVVANFVSVVPAVSYAMRACAADEPIVTVWCV